MAGIIINRRIFFQYISKIAAISLLQGCFSFDNIIKIAILKSNISSFFDDTINSIENDYIKRIYFQSYSDMIDAFNVGGIDLILLPIDYTLKLISLNSDAQIIVPLSTSISSLSLNSKVKSQEITSMYFNKNNKYFAYLAMHELGIYNNKVNKSNVIFSESFSSFDSFVFDLNETTRFNDDYNPIISSSNFPNFFINNLIVNKNIFNNKIKIDNINTILSNYFYLLSFFNNEKSIDTTGIFHYSQSLALDFINTRELKILKDTFSRMKSLDLISLTSENFIYPHFLNPYFLNNSFKNDLNISVS